MHKKDCFYLGHTVKLHGYKGELSIKLDVDNPWEYKELESVFIEIDEQLIPFFIKQIDVKDKGFAVVRFDGVDNLEQAQRLLSKELYLPLSVLPALNGNKFYYHEVVDFTVVDKNFGVVGIVKQVLDFPNQAVLQVFKDNKEILIPVNDEIIKSVDRIQKEVITETPEGLIALYLK
ncbi:MAG: 16S rRNA processing protein RimM [Bacteroidetes bacterium]|nr:16S rRNA processing protein RimM [Bacteroidota bacterium]HET6244484.1 ribosome maturation factor RimM [Bacteroidia bacterium]